MINLRLEEITDPLIRDNFLRLDRALKEFTFLKGNWRFVEIEFAGAVTNYKFPHGLNFMPRDVLQTSKTGAGSLTWNYDSFDRTNLDITTTGACTVRAFVGSYRED